MLLTFVVAVCVVLVWSLGCVIIEMASAKPPWSEQNFENPFRALYHIGNSEAIPLIPDTLSPVGVAFVKQCLRRNPDERPDAETLLAEEWLSGIESAQQESDDDDDDQDGAEGQPQYRVNGGQQPRAGVGAGGKSGSDSD
jgi:serine/threonine protein kinase